MLLRVAVSRVGARNLLKRSMLATQQQQQHPIRFVSTASAAASSRCNEYTGSSNSAAIWMAAVAAATVASAAGTYTSCETAGPVNPSSAGHDDIAEDTVDPETMPVFTSADVSKNDGEDGRPIWMTYGGLVYDVTRFIPNHPGGSEKIMMAAGSAIEPYWYLYRQHFASDLPMRLMEKMIIGRLDEKDQAEIEAQMDQILEDNEDPYAREPTRHAALKVHSDTPMNAEVPPGLLTKNYLTPASLFYIRHHHPVPYLTENDLMKYRLQIDLSEMGKGILEISLDDLKKMPKVEVTATLQCSGNRRGNFNEFNRTSGTSWGQGAVSTAKWGGVRLTDLLKLAGMDDPLEAQEKLGMEHVRFESLDGMSASIGVEKACNPYGDVIIAYEMNDEPLPRDHGFPVRTVVPGYAAVRNVKWVSKIKVAKTEAEGPWQRGLNYKTLPPSVTDASSVDLEKMPSMTEASLFSGITVAKRCYKKKMDDSKPQPGDTVMMKTSGWAWAGGGRNIVRVDVTGDGGKTWNVATIEKGGDQKFGRAWAWVFWTCHVPAIVGSDGTVELSSKAVDLAFNSQPEKCDHAWNVRGLGNNSWFRTHVRLD
eukprot:CAMPEP_0198281636 /NCGR_PEP_ID=MMETSP1449-20131203/1545_1 /TAXON_ID=420275 /ORGANISM="Attheya septentrionalis, Strain CCMP2084" /LENGTH=592 /DNA_ID=CAMNT_0043977509 /DNA_START=123 /DNA_END=1901 /DNA_ORIENTATION=+